MGPTIFWGIQGPIIIGPHQFQKHDYTPDIYSIDGIGQGLLKTWMADSWVFLQITNLKEYQKAK